MSHPMDHDALYHCTCGEWHTKRFGAYCYPNHKHLASYPGECACCGFKLGIPYREHGWQNKEVCIPVMFLPKSREILASQIGQRAAEIADAIDEDNRTGTGDEWEALLEEEQEGWRRHLTMTESPSAWVDTKHWTSAHHAGWLAREIWDHSR